MSNEEWDEHWYEQWYEHSATDLHKLSNNTGHALSDVECALPSMQCSDLYNHVGTGTPQSKIVVEQTSFSYRITSPDHAQEKNTHHACLPPLLECCSRQHFVPK
jgi:hypothetical protein